MKNVEEVEAHCGIGWMQQGTDQATLLQRQRQIWRYLLGLCESSYQVGAYAEKLIERLQAEACDDLTRPEYAIIKMACVYLAETQVDDQCYDLVTFVKLADLYRFRDVKAAVLQVLLFLDFDLCV